MKSKRSQYRDSKKNMKSHDSRLSVVPKDTMTKEAIGVSKCTSLILIALVNNDSSKVLGSMKSVESISDIERAE